MKVISLSNIKIKTSLHLNSIRMLLKAILIFIAYFSIVNTNIFKNFSYVDLFLITYILISIFLTKVKISKITLHLIIASNIAIILSVPLVIFSYSIQEPFLYLTQLWIIFTLVPLFFECITSQKLLPYFAKTYWVFFIITSIGFLFFGILHFLGGYNSFLFYGVSGLHRISFGDTLVSNDLGILMASGLFFTIHFCKNKTIRFFLAIIVSIAYFFTLSKSIMLLIIVFWLYYSRHHLLKFAFFASFGIYLIFPYLLNLQRIDRLIDISRGGGGRIAKISEAFAKFEVFFIPLHGQQGNILVDINYGVQAVHNFLLNIFVNLGVFQSIILLIPIIFYLYSFISKPNKDSLHKWAIVTFLLQLIILSLNALMLTRMIWIAILIVFYYLNYTQTHNEKLKYESFTNN